jgi:hypothetical protein
MSSLLTTISTTRHFKGELPVGEMVGMIVFAGHTLCATSEGVFHLAPQGWVTLKAGDPAKDLRPRGGEKTSIEVALAKNRRKLDDKPAAE